MDGIDDVGVSRRYGRTLIAWLLTVAVPPFVVVGLIARAVSERCEPDSVDCSWGVEYLLAIPVLLASVLTLEPSRIALDEGFTGLRDMPWRPPAVRAYWRSEGG